MLVNAWTKIYLFWGHPVIATFHLRWGLGTKDMVSLRKLKSNVEQVVEIDRHTLAKYLNDKIGADIFMVS